jgi:hypothetical protein
VSPARITFAVRLTGRAPGNGQEQAGVKLVHRTIISSREKITPGGGRASPPPVIRTVAGSGQPKARSSPIRYRPAPLGAVPGEERQADFLAQEPPPTLPDLLFRLTDRAASSTRHHLPVVNVLRLPGAGSQAIG